MKSEGARYWSYLTAWTVTGKGLRWRPHGKSKMERWHKAVSNSDTALFLPLALLAEHEGEKFVLLFGGHAIQQAGKFLPHGIGWRRIFAQQVADGAVQVLGQHLNSLY